MDVTALTDDQERAVQDLMAESEIDRFTALAALGLLPGEVSGDGDLYRLRPLSDKERAVLGLGREPDAIAPKEQTSYAKDAGESGPVAAQDQVDGEAVGAGGRSGRELARSRRRVDAQASAGSDR